MDDQKNLVIAVALSLAIMVGFHYFYERPQLEARQAAIAEAQQKEAAATPEGFQDSRGRAAHG